MDRGRTRDLSERQPRHRGRRNGAVAVGRRAAHPGDSRGRRNFFAGQVVCPRRSVSPASLQCRVPSRRKDRRWRSRCCPSPRGEGMTGVGRGSSQPWKVEAVRACARPSVPVSCRCPSRCHDDSGLQGYCRPRARFSAMQTVWQAQQPTRPWERTDAPARPVGKSGRSVP
jgi:hypothetical protein